VTHVRDAWVDQATVDAQWQGLGFTARPDFGLAVDQHDVFIALLREAGATVHQLRPGPGTTLDAIYARDGSVACSEGMVLCAMGKAARAAEPSSQAQAFEGVGVPVLGRIEPPGCVEGGDLLWLAPRTLAVGIGYRTNASGAAQLRRLLGSSIDELIEVPLPHWRGPGDVLHLMSLVSPVDRDLAVVYSPLITVTFRQHLASLGISFIEVPEEEFHSTGVNVLALGPRQCLMLAGNPATRNALEQAGATVVEYDGSEISIKGCGGPTCLTRPLIRAAVD
jgi:N-dimethylarginine dimethylaminohydrolase